MPDFPLLPELQEPAPRIGGPAQRTGLDGPVADQGGGAAEQGYLRPARQTALPVLVHMAEDHPPHLRCRRQQGHQALPLLQGDGVEARVADC